MKAERSIMIIRSASLDVFPEVLKFIADYMEKRGEKAFLRNTEHGYEIYVPAQPDEP